MDKVTRKKVRVIATGSVVGHICGGVAVLPQETWSAFWGNFFGAMLVAQGGLLAACIMPRLCPMMLSMRLGRASLLAAV